MNRMLKKFIQAFSIAQLLILLSAIQASEKIIKIAEPSEKDIAYGLTKIAVSVDPKAKSEISRVGFYLSVHPDLVCSDREYPFECELDVGNQLQGWDIRAKAYDRSGILLDEASVSTRAFPKPTKVSKFLLSDIPVRIDRDENQSGLSLRDTDLSCRFDGNECKVLSVKKLSDILEEEQADAVAAYLEIVVDLSESMQVSTDRMREGLENIVDLMPKNTKLRLSSFSDFDSLKVLTVSNNGGFTTNRKIILNAVDKVRESEGKTCLFSNVEKLIDAQPPYKIIRRIILITDCVDTCDELASRDRVIEHARELADVIDIYRTKDRRGTHPEVFKCEALATATGGDIYNGELVGLNEAIKSIVARMHDTYLLDIALPDDVRMGKARKLELSPAMKNVKLKYSEYHEAGLATKLSLSMLKADHPLVKLQALRRLEFSDDPKIITEIIKAYESEDDSTIRAKEIETICDLIGANLLHKEDLKSKKEALKAAEALHKIGSEFTEQLEPFLKVFLKKEQNKDLRSKAASFIEGKNERER